MRRNKCPNTEPCGAPALTNFPLDKSKNITVTCNDAIMLNAFEYYELLK